MGAPHRMHGRYEVHGSIEPELPYDQLFYIAAAYMYTSIQPVDAESCERRHCPVTQVATCTRRSNVDSLLSPWPCHPHLWANAKLSFHITTTTYSTPSPVSRDWQRHSAAAHASNTQGMQLLHTRADEVRARLGKNKKKKSHRLELMQPD